MRKICGVNLKKREKNRRPSLNKSLWFSSYELCPPEIRSLIHISNKIFFEGDLSKTDPKMKLYPLLAFGFRIATVKSIIAELREMNRNKLENFTGIMHIQFLNISKPNVSCYF